MNFVAWGLLFIQFIFDLSILLGLLFFDDKTVIKNQNEHRCNKGKRKSTVYLFIALFNESKGIKKYFGLVFKVPLIRCSVGFSHNRKRETCFWRE